MLPVFIAWSKHYVIHYPHFMDCFVFIIAIYLSRNSFWITDFHTCVNVKGPNSVAGGSGEEIKWDGEKEICLIHRISLIRIFSSASLQAETLPSLFAIRLPATAVSNMRGTVSRVLMWFDFHHSFVTPVVIYINVFVFFLFLWGGDADDILWVQSAFLSLRLRRVTESLRCDVWPPSSRCRWRANARRSAHTKQIITSPVCFPPLQPIHQFQLSTVCFRIQCRISSPCRNSMQTEKNNKQKRNKHTTCLNLPDPKKKT